MIILNQPETFYYITYDAAPARYATAASYVAASYVTASYAEKRLPLYGRSYKFMFSLLINSRS